MATWLHMGMQCKSEKNIRSPAAQEHYEYASQNSVLLSYNSNKVISSSLLSISYMLIICLVS